MIESLRWVHIGAGIAAILLGWVAVVAPKGSRLHVSSGTWFAIAMIVLGISASILEPFREPQPGSPLVGLLVCYFVVTAWVAARRRDGVSGWFEIGACIVALSTSALVAWGGFMESTPSTPVGRGPVFGMAALLLLAGLLDLNAVLRRKLSAVQRLSRHLWRMSFAFFIATGSFFLGQQQVMPEAIRGSPVLLVLGFAPLAVMAFWLVRLRFAEAMSRISLRLRPPEPAASAVPKPQMEI